MIDSEEVGPPDPDELEFPPPDAPTDVPVSKIGPPPPPEPYPEPANYEYEIAKAAMAAGEPLQDGVPEGARVEDFKPQS